ncbi:redoxin domain-containing protein, partial [Gammaproteobacteria bacterium]|nr:redoxin domain-containing protein [Gammaproteobacteria bacterium]
MYSQHFLTTLLILFTTLTGSVFAADRVGDFSLLDQEGYFHQMSWYDNSKAIALMVHARHDDEVKAKLPAFMKLKAAYEKKGIKLFMINSSGLENRKEIKADLASMGVSIPVLMDDAKVIS